MNDKCAKFILDRIRELKGIEVGINSKFEDVSLDSIEFIQLIVQIEEYFNIEFSEEELNLEMYSYIIDLANIIASHI